MKSHNTRGSGVFTLKSFHTNISPSADADYVECIYCKSKTSKDRLYDITNRQIIKYFKKKVKGMPPIIKELYPDMDNDEYEVSKELDSFLGRKMKVCDACYIKLSDPRNPLQTDRKTTHTKSPANHPPPASMAYPLSGPTTPKSSHPPSSNTSRTVTPRIEKRASSRASAKSSLKLLHSSTSSTRNSPPTNANEIHQEAYYLHLYEELDTLREEIKLLKTQLVKAMEGAPAPISTDKNNEELVTGDGADSISGHEEVQNESDHTLEDIKNCHEQIFALTATVQELQAKEQEYKEAAQRNKSQQEQEAVKHKNEVEHLQGTINLLAKEKHEMQKRSETMLEGDRAHMLAEIEQMKKRLENDKAKEVNELIEEIETTKLSTKVQIEKIVKNLAEERNTREQMASQIKDLTKQLDLAKARLKVNQMNSSEKQHQNGSV